MNKVYQQFTPLWSRKKMRFYDETIGLGQSNINKMGYTLAIMCMYIEIVFGIIATCIYAFASVPAYVELNFIWQGLTAFAILIVNLALVGDIYNKYYEVGYTIWFAIDACLSIFDTCDAWVGTKEFHTVHLNDSAVVVEIPRVHQIEALCITFDAIILLGILIGYIMTHWKTPKLSVPKRKFKEDWKEYKRSLSKKQ